MRRSENSSAVRAPHAVTDERDGEPVRDDAVRVDEREVRHVGGLGAERLRLRHARDARAEREVKADERGDAARAAEEHEDERARHADDRKRPKQR